MNGTSEGISDGYIKIFECSSYGRMCTVLYEKKDWGQRKESKIGLAQCNMDLSNNKNF